MPASAAGAVLIRQLPKKLAVLHVQSVGIAEGIFGTFCAASGIPAGWCADRIRRDRTLRFCGIVMLGEYL